MIHLLASVVTQDALRIVGAAALLLGIVLAGFLGVWLYRRYKDRIAEAEPVWTFEDLRQLRDHGDISEQEYQVLRASLVGSFVGELGQQRQNGEGGGGVVLGADEDTGPVVWEAPSPFAPRDGREEQGDHHKGRG